MNQGKTPLSRKNEKKEPRRVVGCLFRFIVTVLGFALTSSVGFVFVDAIPTSNSWGIFLILLSCNLIFTMGLFAGYLIARLREGEYVKFIAVLRGEYRSFWPRKLTVALREVKDTQVIEAFIGGLKSGYSYIQQNAPWVLKKTKGCLSFLLIPFSFGLCFSIGLALSAQIGVLSDFGGTFLVLFSCFIILLLGAIPGYLYHGHRDEERSKFIAALKNECWYVRKGAAVALGRMKDHRAVASLIVALKDENAAVRGEAAKALGRVKDHRAIQSLMKALEDEIWFVRRAAGRALGKIKDPLALNPLVAALKDENPEVRGEAAKALGRINDPQAIRPLIAVLKDKSPDVRENTAKALKNIVRREGSGFEEARQNTFYGR